MIGAGVTLFEALKAHDELKAKGISIRVIDLYSVQPIDAASLIEAGKQTGRLITVEDHYFSGGLGDAVAHAVARRGSHGAAARGCGDPAQRQARRAHRQVRHLGAPHRQCSHRLTMKRPPPFLIFNLAFLISLALATGHAQAPVGVQEPAWSPDGKRIAVSYLDRIWTLTADGKQAKAVTTGDATTIEREPAWSPDGNKLAFAADRGEGFDIFVVSLKNGIAVGAPVAVTTTAGDERWPSWTADGRLVFAHRDVKPEGRPADPSLQFDLFLLSPVAGSDAWQAPVPLTETTDSETYPRVSPDGTKVAFISERDSEDDVDMWWMAVPSAAIAKPIPLGTRPPKPVSSSVPAVGENGRPLRAIRMTRVRGHEAYPSWAPDNTRVAFYAVREGIGSVWVATAEPPRPEGDGGSAAAREARCATATGVAEGRRAGVVARRQVAARLRPAGSATGLQRQSAPQ